MTGCPEVDARLQPPRLGALEDSAVVDAPVAGGSLGEPILRVRGISKTFVTRERSAMALHQVGLDIGRGEFLSLVGPSGSGKTTLLRIIAGLESADEGAIWLEGSLLRGISNDMAYVFQDINLLPWRSVAKNVELGLKARGLAKDERRRQALDALALVGLDGYADAAPYTLSGGMQQRVGVARALAVKPKVLLMDEPFGQLDNFTRSTLQSELGALAIRLAMTVVFVTHDVDEAVLLSDRIALFHGSPGRVTEVVSVDLPRPRSEEDVRRHSGLTELRSHIIASLVKR